MTAPRDTPPGRFSRAVPIFPLLLIPPRNTDRDHIKTNPAGSAPLRSGHRGTPGAARRLQEERGRRGRAAPRALPAPGRSGAQPSPPRSAHPRPPTTGAGRSGPRRLPKCPGYRDSGYRDDRDGDAAPPHPRQRAAGPHPSNGTGAGPGSAAPEAEAEPAGSGAARMGAAFPRCGRAGASPGRRGAGGGAREGAAPGAFRREKRLFCYFYWRFGF